nr:unnamed protein product [Callosobruchus chinensis]
MTSILMKGAQPGSLEEVTFPDGFRLTPSPSGLTISSQK